MRPFRWSSVACAALLPNRKAAVDKLNALAK
jgi:hypothetical protein